jgi:hypothetical protein
LEQPLANILLIAIGLSIIFLPPTRFQPGPGSVAHEFTVDGEWRLDGMSTNGRWLVLTRLPDQQKQTRRQDNSVWQTEIQVFDTQDGRANHTITLGGSYEIDAISGAVTALFLFQHLPPANPDHYLIRAYDFVLDIDITPTTTKNPAAGE